MAGAATDNKPCTYQQQKQQQCVACKRYVFCLSQALLLPAQKWPIEKKMLWPFRVPISHPTAGSVHLIARVKSSIKKTPAINHKRVLLLMAGVGTDEELGRPQVDMAAN